MADQYFEKIPRTADALIITISPCVTYLFHQEEKYRTDSIYKVTGNWLLMHLALRFTGTYRTFAEITSWNGVRVGRLQIW